MIFFLPGCPRGDIYRSEKEKLASQLEQSTADANANLGQIEHAISSVAEELKKKKSEIKGPSLNLLRARNHSAAILALTNEIAPALQSEDHDPVETVAAAISLAQSDADRFKE